MNDHDRLKAHAERLSKDPEFLAAVEEAERQVEAGEAEILTVDELRERLAPRMAACNNWERWTDDE